MRKTSRPFVSLLLFLSCSTQPRSAVWQVRTQGGLEPIATGAERPTDENPQTCQSCHPRQFGEWQQSRHAQAWDNRIFQSEFREAPKAWCVHCHAPTKAQFAAYQNNPYAPQLSQGISCAACHMRNGRMVSSQKAQKSPHDTIISASFGSKDFCADCHQFNFPRFAEDGSVTATSHVMQNTVVQFAQSSFASHKQQCRQCHQGHTYAGSHDPNMLARAMDVSVCKDQKEILRVEVSNRAAGHNVPTGDVNRHVLVQLWDPRSPEKTHEIFIGRRFEPLDDGGKKTIFDSTIAAQTSRDYAVDPKLFMTELSAPFFVRMVYVYAPEGEGVLRLGHEETHVTFLQKQLSTVEPCR